MLNTYIKNRGITQTLVHNNNDNNFNQIDWDADYDGNIANISISSDTNGNKEHFDIKLINEDLASILNIPSIDMPIDKRLKSDFSEPVFRHDPSLLQIELPYENEDDNISSVHELLKPTKSLNYLSSPSPNEELIVPITIDEKTFDKYMSKPRKYKKTHKTYKVYKKPKSSIKTNKSRTKTSKPKSSKSSKISKNFTLF
jgi:hypothetical protein